MSLEFHPIHTDDHITESPFQAELIGDATTPIAHLPLHVGG